MNSSKRSTVLSLLTFVLLASMVMTTVISTAHASQVEEGVAQHRRARRNTVRSIIVDHGSRLKAKRQTQAQQEEAAQLKAWNDNFQAQNKAWQQYANEQLAQGKIPKEFDAWEADQGSDSASQSSTTESATATATSTGADETDTATDSSLSASPTANNLVANDGSSGSSTQAQSSTKSHRHKKHKTKKAAKAAAATATSASSSSKSNNKTTSSSSSSRSSNNNGNSASSQSTGTGSMSGVSNVVQGEATYFNVGLGACGWTNQDSDYIVALPHSVWDNLGGTVSNGNVVCGHKLRVSNGKTTIDVTVADKCPSCDAGHIDLSPSAFSALGSFDQGVLSISWGWVGSVPSRS